MHRTALIETKMSICGAQITSFWDHAAADMVDTMIKALNDPAFFKP
jgi:hypothetical protein